MRALPFLIAATFTASAPAAAASYSAVPATPAAERIIHKGVTWHCAAGVCRASTEESRPAVLCQGIAKRVGRLQAFHANGRPFTPGELERCNLSARD